MSLEKELFYNIARSHMYWGRKPISSFNSPFENLKPGDVVIDPFCGGGSAVVAALLKGARVLASDINPMAVFLTRVLIKPVSIHELNESYEIVKEIAEKRILEKYLISCPKCRKKIPFDYLKWTGGNDDKKPEAVKLTCRECSYSGFDPLSSKESERQKLLSTEKPDYWFPEVTIQTIRKTNVNFYHELFTRRNLSALSELNNAIECVGNRIYKDILQYVFTGMLYSCSQMQMFSNKYPSTSRGWTAPRFYLPSDRQEKNVWNKFRSRFQTMIRCKIKLNSSLPFVKVADDIESFERTNCDALVYQSDFRNFRFANKTLIKQVFLDPPYVDDVDYIGFSKFWGSWLNMRFDEEMEWSSLRGSIDQNKQLFKQLLTRIKRNTLDKTNITIAFGAKTQRAWRGMIDAIITAGYEIRTATPVIWDNSYKRSQSVQPDSFIAIKQITKRRSSLVNLEQIANMSIKNISPMVSFITPKASPQSEHQNNTISINKDIYPYIRSAIFLNSFKGNSADSLRDKVDKLAPKFLGSKIDKLKPIEIANLIKDNESNSKAYHELCLNILNVILANDKLEITYLDTSYFSNHVELGHFPIPTGVCKGSAFVAEREDLKIAFCFDDQDRNKLKELANQIHQIDGQDYKVLCVLIVKSYKDLNEKRRYKYSDNWPRGFFLCFDEIVKRASEVNKDRIAQLTSYVPEKMKDVKEGRVKEFDAQVLENIPVGAKTGEAKHYILVIKANDLRDIVPGQFLMINTFCGHSNEGKTNTTSLSELKRNPLAKERILTRKSFLKRPFGIHRASYRHFTFGYLKSLSLPCTLASITHTVFPHKFEIFYKVLDDGVGTNELKKATKGDTLRVSGPLGTKLILSDLRQKDIEEVHLIGGGVGMAPLIYIGQALKYYSFKVKAFIGIESFEKLIYKDYHAGSMKEDAKNAYIYIDDLEKIGLTNEDIYVSYEDETDHVKIDQIHRFKGFVTRQYNNYLIDGNRTKKVMAIACGPTPMMKRLATISKEYDIPLKVLLEKRMACGIGVCLSCVCRKKENNKEKYTRVCVEGPMFDAETIIWE